MVENPRLEVVPRVEDAQYGPRLRLERERRHIGVRELARRVGVSPSLISQIETGKSKASVQTLYAIVTELGTSLDELFAGPTDVEGAARAGRARAKATPSAAGADEDRDEVVGSSGGVQRADGRKAIDLESGVRWELLSASPEDGVDFLYVVYDVGGASSSSEALMRHSGREYGLVLRGKLGVAIQFDQYELGPGDSIAFDSTLPHRLWNASDEPAHAVWFVLGRHGGARFARGETGRSAEDAWTERH